MDNIDAYLDERSLLSVIDAESGEVVFSKLKRDLQDLLALDITVFAGDIYSFRTGLLNGACLYEWIYDNASLAGLDQADVRDLLTLFQRCSDYAAAEAADLRLHWLGDETEAISVACRHAWLAPQPHELSALICPDQMQVAGIRELSNHATGERRLIFVLNRENDSIDFCRAALRVTREHDELFAQLGRIAFPTILFAEKLRPTALGVDLDTHMSTLVDHLAFLSDRYCDIATEVNWDLFRLTRAAQAAGIDLSDESSNTKGNARAMRQRTVAILIDGVSKNFTCSMHTKIEPTRGRVHFCVDRQADVHLIVVGLFDRHLDT